MGIENLFYENDIPTAPDTDKHKRPGWVNIACPFCNRKGKFHLGFNLRYQYFNCWACGGKSTIRVIKTILGVSEQEAHTLAKEYQDTKTKGKPKTSLPKENKLPFGLPSNLKEIKGLPPHKRYLENRGFNWEFLVERFNIKGTTYGSEVKTENSTIDLSWRIVIPIWHQGQIVSWQTRSIGNKDQNIPYISCPHDMEAFPHKSILYPNLDSICVFLTEGIMDCWKIRQAGFPAVCSFGTEVSTQQIKSLLKKEVIIFADGDAPGLKSAKKTKARIEFATGNEVKILQAPQGKDPGDLAGSQLLKIFNKNGLLQKSF